MNDETIFEPNEVKDGPQTTEAVSIDETVMQQQPNQPADATVTHRKGDSRTSRVAAAAGLVGFAVGVLTPANLFPDPVEEIQGDNEVVAETEPEPELAPQPEADLVGRDMKVADTINDEMSFSEAFATARQEVGPGGLFAWHGHTYGTYYGNEWNAMTEEERDQYWADVYHTTSQIDYHPEAVAEEGPTIELDEDDLDKAEEEYVEDNRGDEVIDINHGEGMDQVLVLHENDVYVSVDINDDGQADGLVVDADGNDNPDLVLDTDGDGNPDLLLLDPTVDDEGYIVAPQDNVIPIDGVIVTPDDGQTDFDVASV